MLKRYLGGRRRNQDNNIPFDSERLWEFRYKLQYEEPRVKVIQQGRSHASHANDVCIMDHKGRILCLDGMFLELQKPHI